jgi:hypothetical protein
LVRQKKPAWSVAILFARIGFCVTKSLSTKKKPDTSEKTRVGVSSQTIYILCHREVNLPVGVFSFPLPLLRASAAAPASYTTRSANNPAGLHHGRQQRRIFPSIGQVRRVYLQCLASVCHRDFPALFCASPGCGFSTGFG